MIQPSVCNSYSLPLFLQYPISLDSNVGTITQNLLIPIGPVYFIISTNIVESGFTNVLLPYVSVVRGQIEIISADDSVREKLHMTLIFTWATATLDISTKRQELGLLDQGVFNTYASGSTPNIRCQTFSYKVPTFHCTSSYPLAHTSDSFNSWWLRRSG